ncbi:MAG: adenylate/guanylate cyclase domain-containing protein [Desulfatiglandales bacterium]
MTPNNKKYRSRFAFSLVMLFILIVASLYFYNIVRWANEPEWGFIFRSGSAIDIIGQVGEKGHQAGLQSGDRLVSINGKTFQTLKERRAFRNYGLGEKNTYVIERGSDRFEVTITNTFPGFWKSFKKCGFPYVVGLSYVFIGVLIFLMKPHRHDSWVFLIFATCLGLLMGFLLRGGVLRPSWLNTIHIFLYSFTPGAIIHLALSVPVKRNLIVKHPLVEFLPYVASLLLFIGIRSSAYEMQAISRTWYLILLSYFVPALLVFIVSCLHLWLRSSSVIAGVRAQAILFGASIAASLPILDMVFSNLFKIYLVPSLNYYLPFLIIFPLSIGYAIVKHNLFDIAAAIRVTYGYVLLTVSIAVLYFLVIVILSSLFGDLWQKKSHFLFLAVVIVVMLLFSFLRKRLQTYVDRIFFRMDFNYQETVEKIGAAMRSLLNLEQIVAFMKDICENVLFAGTSYVMLLNRNENTYEAVSAPFSVPKLPANEPLIQNIARQKREVVRYNIDEDPLFAIDREACRDTFKRLGASLIVPLIYEDRLAGFMALGEKKSGKFYRYEDILLLKTMTNQGAVALQNARLFTELEQQTDMLTKTNIQLEEEVNQRKKALTDLKAALRKVEILESIKANLSKFVPTTVTRMIERSPTGDTLEAKERDVSVLFLDIEGYTKMSEELGSIELNQIIEKCFSVFMDAIYAHNGDVNETAGDGLMVIFPSEDETTNALNAVRAAITIREKAGIINKEDNTLSEPLLINMGINSGQALVGAVKFESYTGSRWTYTARGRTTNLAARIGSLASGGSLLLSRSTADRVKDYFSLKPLGKVTLKNVSEKMEIFSVLA